MYRKILVPLDGSAFSDGILPYVRWLAFALKLPVELLYVNDPGGLGSRLPKIQRGEFLEKIAASLPDTLAVKRTVEPGEPAQVIVKMAHAEAGTLVAMSTHGYSGAARWLLGSVTDKVLHAPTGDLLLVRPEGASGSAAVELQTVVVPLDCSQTAENVLPAVSELAGLLHLEILLAHVTKHFYAGPPDAFLPVFGAIPDLKEIWERDKAAGNRYLSETADQLRARGVSRLSTRLLEGGVDGAAGEIIELAQKIPGSLIAMTRHGQSGIGQWLIGSVTKRVVQHSRRPVLVVRAQP
jgi:nucleotide-binding universal stress UspA family protein